MLPCSFQPGSEETIQWFRQDDVVYSFKRDFDDDDSDSSEEDHEDQQLAGRASVFPNLISHGNATLILREGGLKDRGMYRCHVRTSNGEHNANIILKMEGKFMTYLNTFIRSGVDAEKILSEELWVVFLMECLLLVLYRPW